MTVNTKMSSADRDRLWMLLKPLKAQADEISRKQKTVFQLVGYIPKEYLMQQLAEQRLLFEQGQELALEALAIHENFIPQDPLEPLV